MLVCFCAFVKRCQFVSYRIVTLGTWCQSWSPWQDTDRDHHAIYRPTRIKSKQPSMEPTWGWRNCGIVSSEVDAPGAEPASYTS